MNRVLLVPHEASGPAAFNWALDHPDRVAGVVALNTFYAALPDVSLTAPDVSHLCIANSKPSRAHSTRTSN